MKPASLNDLMSIEVPPFKTYHIRTLTLKTINSDLAKRGQKARLERGDGYFYFWTGEATDWLDKTVSAHSGEPHAGAVGGEFSEAQEAKRRHH